MDSIERISSHPALAEAEILRLRGLTREWTRVQDRLPPSAHSVIVYGRKYGTHHPGKRVYETYIGTRPLEVVEDEEITHWMPLPEPPSDGMG